MQTEKSKLYQCADELRTRFCVPVNQPIDTVELLSTNPKIDIEYQHFNNPGLCGLAMVGEKVDTIVLNTTRGSAEQNFDCGHELIHLVKHRDIQDSFSCFTKAHPQQNSFREWQANEGAAQFLVPYQDFIPRFLSYTSASSLYTSFGIQEMLADHYHVPPRVISIRLDSLSYEIDQYRCGVSLDCIELLSRNQRQKRGIQTSCYNAVCAFGLNWDSAVG